METKEINKKITAFVDNELDQPNDVNDIKKLIENDRNINFDYKLQFFMKSIISESMKIHPAPERIRKKIIRKIKPFKFF